MTDRIHVLVDRAEKERFRRAAARRGMSLSEWLREAGEEKLLASSERSSLESAEALLAFFAECDASEPGAEPDWEIHREVIEGSRSSGAAPT
jgi:hypothetical protein